MTTLVSSNSSPSSIRNKSLSLHNTTIRGAKSLSSAGGKLMTSEQLPRLDFSGANLDSFQAFKMGGGLKITPVAGPVRVASNLSV